MYYPSTSELPLSLPICYQCGSGADIPLNHIDFEVDPNEISVEELSKHITSIVENKYT